MRDPCDSVDIEQAVPQLAATPGPTYLRLLRGKVPTVLDEYDYTFELGKAKVLRTGRDVVFVSSGLMTMRALQAAEKLAAHHVDVAVVHTPTIKPFDADTVLREIDTDRLAVTLENHTEVGGLFETVAAAATCGRTRTPDRPGRAAGCVPGRRRAADPARSLRARRRSDRRARTPATLTAAVRAAWIDLDFCRQTNVDNHVARMRSLMTSTPVLNGLTKTNLREQALASLRIAITSGQIPPQTQMVETDLSEQLGISRGTLREAMRQLQQEGLLAAGGRGRLYVRRLGPRRSPTSSRCEQPWRDSPPAPSPKSPSALRSSTSCAALLRSMSRAADELDLEGRIESDLAFHRSMCRLTGNDSLLHTWQGLEGSIRMSIMFAGTTRAIGNMDVQRHDAIVDAISFGDGPAAYRAVQEHMAWAARNLTDDGLPAAAAS